MDHSRFSNFSSSLRLCVITGKIWSPKMWGCSHYTLLTEPGLPGWGRTICTSGRGGSQPSLKEDTSWEMREIPQASEQESVSCRINNLLLCFHILHCLLRDDTSVKMLGTATTHAEDCWKSHRLLRSSGLTLLISIKGERNPKFITWPVTLRRHYYILYIL